MRKSGDKTTVTIDQLDVVDRFYCQHADAYLVLGKFKPGQKTIKQYALGWQSRHQDEIIDCRFYNDPVSATRTYKKMALEDDRPDHEHLTTDWQQDRVYDWEDKFLLSQSRKISQDQAHKLVHKVSRDYGIRSPKLAWEKAAYYSDYDMHDRVISFGHRDMVSLLHEMAHVIYLENHEDRDQSNHPPAFVWIALELYHRYAGFDLGYMITSAHEAGIIGDIAAPQMLYSHSLAKNNGLENGRNKAKKDRGFRP